MGASALTAGLEALSLLLDHAQQIRDLMAQPGGTTVADIQTLMATFDSERIRIGKVIAALPDDTTVPTPATPAA